MLKKASAASLPHCPFGTSRRWPPARNTRNSTAEPRPRQSVRNVHGDTSPSATFMAVQLNPHASVSPARSEERRVGKEWGMGGWSMCDKKNNDEQGMM